MTQTQIIAFRFVLVIALVVITHLATTTQPYPVVEEISDKANHVLAFYVLALSVDFSFPQTKLGITKVSGLLVYAIALEAVQSFMPNRIASWLDLIADGIGIALYRLSLPLLRRAPVLRRRWTI